MFCPFCSSPIPDDSKYCPNCRSYLVEEKAWLEDTRLSREQRTAPPQKVIEFNDASATAVQTQDAVSRSTDVPVPTGRVSAEQTPAGQGEAPLAAATTRDALIARAQADGHGMKWYKFLIYFALIAGGVVGILFGLAVFATVFLGMSFLRRSVGVVLLSMGPMVLLQALVQIVLAVVSFVVRAQMAGFKRNAVMLFYVMCIASAVLSTLISLLSGTSLILLLGSLVPNIVYIVLNYLYFNKRAYLFVND